MGTPSRTRGEQGVRVGDVIASIGKVTCDSIGTTCFDELWVGREDKQALAHCVCERGGLSLDQGTVRFE